MKDLIAYLAAQIDNNQRYITMEYNRENHVNYDRIRDLQDEVVKLKGWIKDLDSVRVDSAGMVEDSVFRSGVTCG